MPDTKKAPSCRHYARIGRYEGAFLFLSMPAVLLGDMYALLHEFRMVQYGCEQYPFCYTYSNLFITGQIDSMLTSCFIEAGFTFSEKKARAFLSTGLHRGTHGIVS